MPLLSIYNHLMQGYVMMRQTRFDAHKKSELRDIYQSIRKITSEQPLYKISFDEPAQSYTLGIKNSALTLSSIIKELHVDDGTSVFQSKVLASERPELVNVSVLNGSDLSNIPIPLEVSVRSLASSQVNEGKFVPSREIALPPGQYNFTADVEENRYSFQFNVSEGATNLELQTKLSDFINKTSVGLRTQVVCQPELALSRIELTALVPGSAAAGEPAFSLSDTRRPDAAQKGIIEHFGLDQVARMPLNTVFSVNDRQFETRRDNYVYANAVSLSFSSVTDRPVSLSLVTDKGPVLEKVNEFLQSYNSFLDFIKTKGAGNRRSGKLLYDISNIASRYREELSSVGISMDADHKLSANADAVQHAAFDGSLERFSVSKDGFVSSLLRTLSGISLNPMEYLDKTVVTYPNTLARKTFSPYVSSIYSGLLYNNYC